MTAVKARGKRYYYIRDDFPENPLAVPDHYDGGHPSLAISPSNAGLKV